MKIRIIVKWKGWIKSCDLDLGVLMTDGKPIINYALSYRSRNADVGNTIHSVFPLFHNGNIFGTICFVKDYNILERSIPAFLSPKNNQHFADGTNYTFASIIGSDPGFVDKGHYVESIARPSLKT